MYPFQVSIHVCPENLPAGPPFSAIRETLGTLQVTPALLGEMFAVTFEQAAESLSDWERMSVEPDGSFLWVSAPNEPNWQIEGNLYDRNNRLLFVDVKGTCPAHEFDRLLRAFGWPAKSLMFQLTREAVFLSETEFRLYADQPNQQSSNGITTPTTRRSPTNEISP